VTDSAPSPIRTHGRPQALDVVLLHGGWHCGESWGRVPPLLRVAGHRVVTVQLPGHGTDARFPVGYFTADQAGLATAPTALGAITIDTAADVVRGALRDVRASSPDQAPVVLVSHSSAGAIASRVAESAPELIDHLVYIAAMVPSRRTSAVEITAGPEYGSQTMDGLLIGDPSQIGALRINPRSTDPAYRELLHRKFYNDMPTDEADAFLELLVPDQPLSYLTEPVSVTSQRWGSISRTYIVTMRDQAVPPAIQDIVINDADTLYPEHPFRRITIDTGHSPFAAQPEQLAAIIAAVGSADGRR
jgi:pimeloyl-ACP methyl ester carboxylesterase